MSIRYNDNVIRHFLDPINVGVLEHPDGVGVIGDMTCGDMMVMHIQVCDDRLADIKYQVFGCAAAIATCSALSEMAMGNTLDEALAITDNDVIRYLGGLPDPKAHCSTGAASALHQAIADARARRTSTTMTPPDGEAI
jgi:nitrogen fixation NifU-like protein